MIHIRVSTLIFLTKFQKQQFLFYRSNHFLFFFLIFQKRRIGRRMFSFSVPLPKVSAKNIYLCGQKAGKTKTGMARMVYN